MNINFYYDLNCILEDDIDYTFMNHGFYPINEKCKDLFLETSGSLYCELLDQIPQSSGKKIIDTGCGRGGGTHLMKTKYDFLEVHGCDNNISNIDHCKKLFDGITFKIDDAQKLENYENDYFDFAVNIESSHCYKDPIKFSNSIKRILKKDSIFYYGDIFKPNKDQYWDKIFLKDFNILSKRDITENVYMSCEYMERKLVSFFKKTPNDIKLFKYIEIFKSKKQKYGQRSNNFFIYALSPRSSEDRTTAF